MDYDARMHDLLLICLRATQSPVSPLAGVVRGLLGRASVVKA